MMGLASGWPETLCRDERSDIGSPGVCRQLKTLLADQVLLSGMSKSSDGAHHVFSEKFGRGLSCKSLRLDRDDVEGISYLGGGYPKPQTCISDARVGLQLINLYPMN